MNGAEAVVRTLTAGGVEVCFAKPGPTEAHLMAAFDKVDGIRCVTGLFEGVLTGCADGYSRMTGRPTSTLLHLGPGLANGSANLHNASKANSRVINIVGDHPSYHCGLDPSLSSDIQGLAGPFSSWVRTASTPSSIGEDVSDAIAAACTAPGQVTTLVVPADVSWSSGAVVGRSPAAPAAAKVEPDRIERIARILKNEPGTMLLAGGAALRGPGLSIAARIACKTGARLFAPTNAARWARGAGRPIVERIPYPIAHAVSMLSGVRHAILCGAPEPVAFFAYPGKPSHPLPQDCSVSTLAAVAEDVVAALIDLESELDASRTSPPLQQGCGRSPARGSITLDGLGVSIAALLPENTILVDESITSSFTLLPILAGAKPHDHLSLTGGSIGIGLPLATGAAIACPDRTTVCLQADGSAMYTLHALWTQAREQTNTVIVVLANRAYETLRYEFGNVGVTGVGPKALSMVDLNNPELSWVDLANAMGVESTRVTSLEAFNSVFQASISGAGPHLIEVML